MKVTGVRKYREGAEESRRRGTEGEGGKRKEGIDGRRGGEDRAAARSDPEIEDEGSAL